MRIMVNTKPCDSVLLFTVGCVQLEELLSSVAQHLPGAPVDLLPSVMASCQRQLLELLSEQDGCLIEGLLLSCRITKTLRERYDPLNVCLLLILVSPALRMSCMYNALTLHGFSVTCTKSPECVSWRMYGILCACVYVHVHVCVCICT